MFVAKLPLLSSLDHLQAPQIRHFLYKSRKTSSITSPQAPSLYCEEEEDKQRSAKTDPEALH